MKRAEKQAGNEKKNAQEKEKKRCYKTNATKTKIQRNKGNIEKCNRRATGWKTCKKK